MVNHDSPAVIYYIIKTIFVGICVCVCVCVCPVYIIVMVSRVCIYIVVNKLPSGGDIL